MKFVTRTLGIVGLPLLLAAVQRAADAQGRPWVVGPLASDSARFVELRDRPGSNWQVRRGTRVTLYAPPGSFAARHLDRLVRRAERAYAANLRLLGLPAYRYRLHAFYFDSASHMEAATGRGGMGGGFPEAHTVFMVVNAGRPVPDDGHEFAHVQSLSAWGLNEAADVWLREGLAVLAQPECWGYPVRDLAAAARRAGDRRTMADLSGAGFGAGDVDARFRAYVLSAAFVEHLLSRGRPRFLALWRRGTQAADSAYGAPLSELEARWDRSLPVDALRVARIDLVRVQRAGCQR